MPYRRVATDRAGLNTEAVAAAAAAAMTQQRCEGWITEPAYRDAAGRTRPASRRRCLVLLDPVLTRAGYRTHPGCDPGEVSPGWEPMTWPGLNGGAPDGDTIAPA